MGGGGWSGRNWNLRAPISCWYGRIRRKCLSSTTTASLWWSMLEGIRNMLDYTTPYNSYFSSSESKSAFFEEKQSKETRFRPSLFIWIFYCDKKFSSKIIWKVQDLIVLNQINPLINLYMRINRVITKPSWIIQTPSTLTIHIAQQIMNS